MIGEHFLPHINGGTKIDAVVSEVKKADPFFIRQNAFAGVLQKSVSGILYQTGTLQVGLMCQADGGIAAQTDMFAPVGQGRTVIGSTIFFNGRINTLCGGFVCGAFILFF